MKTIRVSLVGILCLMFILTPLSTITGCKADKPSGYPLQTGSPLVGSVSIAGLDFVLGGLATGALSWAGGQGCDFLFGLITGSGDKTDEELEGIKSKLDDMDKKLNEIKNIVNDIQETVGDIDDNLKTLQWDSAISNTIGATSTIDETFKKVIRMAGDAKNNPGLYEDDVNALSLPNGEILSASTGVINAVGVIHNVMIGQSGQTSLLELRRLQISEGLNYENGADSYDSFALLFTTVLGWEIKGVELVVNAYAGQDKVAAANSYLDEFYTYKLVPQVNLFLSSVEKMVWENNDMSWREVILDPEPYIFPSADYLANTLLNSYYGDGKGHIKAGEDKGIITARVRYPEATAPLDSIQLINTSTDTTITLQPEPIENNYNVLVFKYPDPQVGTYRIVTTRKDFSNAENLELQSLMHNYGEKEIIITEENKYGYVGVYAWKPSSDYYEISSRNSSKPIDVTGAGDKANAQQWQYYGFDNQLWQFKHVGDGYYMIKNKYSGKVLDVLSYSKENNANIIQYTWHDTDNQKWTLQKIEDGYLEIISKNSGKVIEVNDGSRSDGANIQQNQWRGSGNQRWELKPESRDTKQLWKFIPKSKSDFRLDVRGGLGQGSVIQAFKKNNTLAQKWQLVRKSGVYYRLTPKCKTTTAASIRNGYTHSGAIVQTWTYKSGDDNFLWKFEPVGSGYYRIVNKNSGMCMQWINDAVRQIKYSDAKDKDTVKWEIIRTSIK
ncbi:RICIN domain-containing protein [Chloroflexota bacterium]